jgi:hypothetical protein
MTETPQHPLRRILPFLVKLTTGGANALVTLATVQDVVPRMGTDGIPADKEGLPEGLREELAKLEAQFAHPYIQEAIEELLRCSPHQQLKAPRAWLPLSKGLSLH